MWLYLCFIVSPSLPLQRTYRLQRQAYSIKNDQSGLPAHGYFVVTAFGQFCGRLSTSFWLDDASWRIIKYYSPCKGKIVYEKFGFWTVDGSMDFGHMPGGIIPGLSDPIPIRLQHGDPKWGVDHIERRHGHWLQKNKQTAASMVHLKLQQSGRVYTAEEDDKTKISMAVSPSALIILRYVPQFEFLTVVTVYGPQVPVDGDFLGYYPAFKGPAPHLRPVSQYAPPPLRRPRPGKKFG